MHKAICIRPPRRPLRRCHMSIPLRDFGKTGVKISALGLGGHHLGGAKDEKSAIEIVRRALDGGITFYDNAWEYYRGKTESWLGLGLKGQRDKAFLMTKVCTHGRDGSLATQMLDQSLRRLSERSRTVHSSRRRRRGAAQSQATGQSTLRRIHGP